MRKFFLIPLMTLCTCVMAFATVHTAGTYQELQDALTAAANGDEIQLTADIAYPKNGTGLINITKSITLDGQGHKLSGYGTANISVSATQNWPVTLAVNYGGEASAALDVTIKNIHVSNKASGTRSYGLMAWDGVDKLTLKNDSIYLGESTASYKQVICFTGTDATPINLKIEDSFIGTATGSGYPAYILKPINGTFNNTKFSGYCALYFKYRATGAYGNVVGSRGSVVNADNCNFDAPNIYSGYSNDFAVFACEDDDITLNLNNCGMNAEVLGNADQTMVSASEWGTRRERNININISGDNSYINGNFVSNGWTFKYGDIAGNKDLLEYENGYWRIYDYSAKAYTNEGYDAGKAFTPYTGRVNVTITGGTYAINPQTYRFDGHVLSAEDISEFEQRNCTIPEGYEVNKIETQQGAQTTTLYRVRKSITGSTALNDNSGQNPTADIKVTENVTLANAETVAEYVEVKGGESTDPKVTVTVPEGKTLEVTNGLDVTGNAEVVVAAGSTVVVGEGGIISEKPENIVIGANENGAASLLLDPKVIVNTTPNLTVKMKAKQIGWQTVLGDKHYFWHRFALPIQEAASWVKNPNKATYVFGWNYTANDWEQLSALTQMVPFKGYTLSADYENLGDVEYTFTGQLAGNTNNLLQFERNGFNFFGNSYTGYIDILALVDQIMGDNKIDGTVWMWYQTNQSYVAIPLQALRENPSAYDAWMREVAPMQTFILKQNGSENATAELNYASAVWGNPRYGNAAPAPRRAEADETTRMRIVVTAENGKSDFVMFTEDGKFSDAFEKGYDGEKYMNENALNMYATVEGTDYTAIATDNVEGKTVTIKTVEDVNYTMSFAKVNGAEYAIRDNVTGAVIAIEEGATYEFAAQPNSLVENRFEILPIAKMPTAIENTEVKANAKGIFTLMGQYLGEDFKALPAGIYVVNGVKIVK